MTHKEAILVVMKLIDKHIIENEGAFYYFLAEEIINELEDKGIVFKIDWQVE